MAIGNIFLVGLMGSGKTTVGRALARKLNRRFVDSDHEIEARTGASIPWIFEIEGESSFRQREAEVIRDLSSQHGIVLATGGGAILQPESREYLKARGTVIYLRASVSSLVARTARDRNRPLLQTADPRARIEQLAHEREPYYLEVADLVIDTGRPNVRFLVQSILDKLGLDAHSNAVTLPLGANYGTNNAQSQSKSIMSESPGPFVLPVELGARSYPILIGSSVFSTATALGPYLRGDHVAVVTNTVVAPLYLDRLSSVLTALGKQVTTIVLPDGEEEKTWPNLMRIFDALLSAKCDRKTTLIALGGGVVGDMTGFAAASYMRGVPFVQIPTTLLAQVDSSVGGKTGINHLLGKNMIGAFYQPQAVLADIETLATLPLRELSAGLAEVIKYGAILDVAFFDWIEANITQLMARDAAALTYAIRRSCEIKVDVVRQDERESGLRAVLNFGHTFGHAIENGLGYGCWLHGEAVGCGMVMAADLSLRLGFIDVATKDRITALVRAAGLPVRAPDLGRARWLELMQVDKKNEGGVIRFILMRPLGTPLITAVPDAVLDTTLQVSVD